MGFRCKRERIPISERVCCGSRRDQKLRQEAFDNYETTDDHGMVFVGTAVDQNGTKYYKVKNSWGTEQIYGGFFYASEAFVKYKTMDILVHKDAVPVKILKKLHLK